MRKNKEFGATAKLLGDLVRSVCSSNAQQKSKHFACTLG